MTLGLDVEGMRRASGDGAERRTGIGNISSSGKGKEWKGRICEAIRASKERDEKGKGVRVQS